MSEREEEHIETHGLYRFKMRGKTIVALEQKCPKCQEHYWQPLHRILGHSCQPERLGGAAVINKYG